MTIAATTIVVMTIAFSFNVLGNGGSDICQHSVSLVVGKVIPYLFLHHTIASDKLTSAARDGNGSIGCYLREIALEGVALV